MAGSVPPNLRKGDFAEALGRLLLRPFCALSPVEKLDDFGIDTIATLLEKDKNSHLRELATSTFAVQFKAKSVRKIDFLKKHETQWLVNLEFPYFLGSVDIDNGIMELHTLNWVTSLPDYHTLKRFTLHLDVPSKKKKGFNIYLGEPILRLHISELNNPTATVRNRTILREWIKAELTNIRHRKLGKTSGMLWETNKLPQLNSGNKMVKAGNEDLELLKSCQPYADALLTELKLFNDDEQLLNAVDTIADKLKELGITLETYDILDFDEIKKRLKE